MPRRAALAFPLALAALLAACGGNGAESPAGGDTRTEAATREAVAVIEEWSEALTASDIDAAADLFAIPSVAENGIRIQIESADDAALFNESLPCGAELEDTESAGGFTTATFRLTTRPGVDACPGEGNTAQTTFVIEDGLIVEWRRVGLPGDGGGDRGRPV
ncbi:hypothetical protein BH24ACT23_BH24ACT23_10470 [soil metagenome]